MKFEKVDKLNFLIDRPITDTYCRARSIPPIRIPGYAIVTRLSNFGWKIIERSASAYG